MGEMADYLMDQAMFPEAYSNWEEEDDNLHSEYWTGKDGTRYEIAKMKSDHILNCIHLIERREAGGINFLDKASTYRHMVNILINRGYISDNYYNMTLDERKKVR